MKKGRKQKKTKKNKTTQSELSFYPCPCTIPPIKTIYIYIKKPTSRTTDQNTDQKRTKEKHFK